MPMSARETALKALGAYRRDNTWPVSSFAKMTDTTGYHADSARETALAMQIVKGVLQNMMLIDYYASHFSSIRLKKLEPRVLDILRISIYQIVFLTKIPSSASVNEGVALTKKYSNARAAGYVNAVLRKTANAAAIGDLPQITADTELLQVSIKYSHPHWFVGVLFDALDRDGALALLEANNAADATVTVQINTLRSSADEVLSMVHAEGMDGKRHSWLDGCVDFIGGGRLAETEAFSKGFFYVQDAASRLAVIAADPKPGDFVIDGCAAPGGKSFATAVAMKDTGRVLAFDLTEAKLRRIMQGAKRLDLSVIETRIKDATTHDGRLLKRADLVLADVPCSGFGVIRKKPEIRYKTEDEIKCLPDIQKRILSNLSACVKPGGTLLYSTCTILRRENEDVIRWFLETHREFSIMKFALPGIGRVDCGMITLWPQIHGTDGFFICKMSRTR